MKKDELGISRYRRPKGTIRTLKRRTQKKARTDEKEIAKVVAMKVAEDDRVSVATYWVPFFSSLKISLTPYFPDSIFGGHGSG